MIPTRRSVILLSEGRESMSGREEVEQELREHANGQRSWCDQHHGLENEIELTARADEATIRLLIARLDAMDRLGHE